MGKTFGNLIHYRRMVYHGLSPFEQKAFTGAVGKGIPNLFRRMRVKVVQVVVRKYLGHCVHVIEICAIFYKGDTYCHFMFAFLLSKSFLKAE